MAGDHEKYYSLVVSKIPRAALPLLLLLIITLSLQITSSQAQAAGCNSELSNLNLCAPYVLPGANGPTTECCNVLQSIQHDCLCNTLRIASRLPSACGLPALSCGN